MTSKEKSQLKQLIRLLSKAADIADTLEIELGNGAYVGSIIGGIADELELWSEGSRHHA